MQTWLIFVPSFYSFFYGGTMGTYLSLHFSVRARALSSLLVRMYTPDHFHLPNANSCSVYCNSLGLGLWQVARLAVAAAAPSSRCGPHNVGYTPRSLFYLDWYHVQSHSVECGSGLRAVCSTQTYNVREPQNLTDIGTPPCGRKLTCHT